MPRERQVIHGHGGLELTIETLEPDLLAMESSAEGTGALPPVHCAPRSSSSASMAVTPQRTRLPFSRSSAQNSSWSRLRSASLDHSG
jgi:hypothetical protein